MSKKLMVIVGPTAIGKTALAITLAKQYQTEIISADSRQFYREMHIGTAKPSEYELAQVKHHFINSHSITDTFNVGDFEKQSLLVLDSIFKKHDVAVLVGGSGLYIHAVCLGFDDLPQAPAAIREQLNHVLLNQGIEPLQEQLQALDPQYFHEVDQKNPQRIIRALEVCLATGIPFSTYRRHKKNERPFECIKIGLNTSDRSLLYQRINERVDQMVADGLEEEARHLLPFRHLNALQTVGYTEFFDYFDRKITRQQAIDRIKQNTRRFAKRQLTWFKKDPEITWVDPSESDWISSIDCLPK